MHPSLNTFHFMHGHYERCPRKVGRFLVMVKKERYWPKELALRDREPHEPDWTNKERARGIMYRRWHIVSSWCLVIELLPSWLRKKSEKLRLQGLSCLLKLDAEAHRTLILSGASPPISPGHLLADFRWRKLHARTIFSMVPFDH